MCPDTEGKWYDGLYQRGGDDELTRGLALLETLRPILPEHKRKSVDRAKAMLTGAAQIYKEASEVLSDQSFDIMDVLYLMPPENNERLLKLCSALADYAEAAKAQVEPDTGADGPVVP